jgi:small conductance mechanosensitive channel
LDGARHYIPNSQIGIVSNMTIHWSRVVIDAGVSYDADLNAVEREMKAAAAGMKADTVFGPMMIEDAEYLGVESFGNSAVNVRILIKTRPQMQWNVAREYRKRMKAAFDAAGIEIPFPQIVVHQAGK